MALKNCGKSYWWHVRHLLPDLVFRLRLFLALYRGSTILREKCFVCGASLGFILLSHWTLHREAQCRMCGARKRNSDAAYTILKTCLGRTEGCLRRNVPELSHLRVYLTQSSGPLHKHLKSLPNFTCSEFWKGIVPGQVHKGVRCEDLTRLTFDSQTFDLIVNEDVLEHVKNFSLAFSEIRRVLKSNGVHIFTVPYNETHTTQRRAMVDEHGRLIQLLQPVYHGDPFRPEGSLVFTDFGNDLLTYLDRLGMRTEDWVLGLWHDPGEVTWIDTADKHAEYWRHYLKGTLVSAFQWNSHVFVSRISEAGRDRRHHDEASFWPRIVT